MNVLYLDLFSGIAGDMFLAAVLDLGVDLGDVERELTKLEIHGYQLAVSRQQRGSISGLKFKVHLEHDDGGHAHAHGKSRTFSDIQLLISQSELTSWVKERSISAFRRIAVAEGKIHGRPAEEVHFHEVGAIDSIIDLVGVAIALDLLGQPRVLASRVIDGQGWIDCAHGRFPVPAPATLAILGERGIGVTQCEEPSELVTPTGAALLAEFVEGFGPMENLTASKIGFGLGTRETKTRPNVLRAILGVEAESAKVFDWESDRVAVLETNLDDCPGQLLGHFMETALAAGALDVFYTPVQMKKGRPGVLLSVLCGESEADKFHEMILRETTALGVRQTMAERRKLRREFVQVKTPAGEITMKMGRLNGQIVQRAPEFESLKEIAGKTGKPVKMLHEAAIGLSQEKP